RAGGLQTAEGLFAYFEHILLFPITFPPDNHFLAHTTDGNLEWLPPGAFGGIVDWSQVINTPITLSGYGITDAYTITQIQAIINGITFADTGFGSPIGGIAVRAQLPAQIAYEDEANTFSEKQIINNELEVNTVSRPLITVTPSMSPYDVQRSDWHINASPATAGVQIRLPDATTNYINGKSAVFTVKKTAPTTTHLVTIKPVIAGQRIDGANGATIKTPYKSLTFVTDGADWFIQ
ncbi:MAG: hypothetical protein GY906_30190, partial [bacterium]|nr:hypothetical protein [bacterium]